MGTLSAYECGNIDEQGPGFRSVWALFANKCGNIYEQGSSIYEQGATTGVALCVSRAEKDLRRGQREGLLVSLGWRPIPSFTQTFL